MEGSVEKDFPKSSLTQILNKIFRVNNIKSIEFTNNESKEIKIKKNELDYFEYTYFSDSAC